MKNWSIDDELRASTRKFTIGTLIGIGMTIVVIGLALEGHYHFHFW